MITSLTVDNYRCFKSLRLSDLKRINIIVGANASGKTALLESIKAGLTGLPFIIPWLNGLRGVATFIPPNPTPEQFQSQFVDIFHDFLSDSRIAIRFTDSDKRKASLEVFFDPRKAVTAQRQPPGFTASSAAQPPATSSVPTTTIIPLAFDRVTFQGEKSVLCATINAAGQLYLEPGKEMGIPCGLFTMGYYGVPPENATWFSNLSKSKRSHEVMEAIQRHFPFIRQCSIETEISGQSTVYVDITDLPRKVPLALVSSGINRLFTLILALLTFSHGVALIDEIENGIFHDQYTQLWKTLDDLATRHDTQLFVSTHSIECLNAAVPIIKQSPDRFTLLQTRKQPDHAEIQVFQGVDLEQALAKGGEVRT